jgi:hypothetical protein
MEETILSIKDIGEYDSELSYHTEELNTLICGNKKLESNYIALQGRLSSLKVKILYYVRKNIGWPILK